MNAPPLDREKGKTPSVQWLMPESGERKTEQPVQPSFRKYNLFSYLALATCILAIHCWFQSMPNRSDLPDAFAPVRYTPLELDPAGFAPLRFAGAWKVEVADARFGGISALVMDGGRLLAVTDSGVLVRLPRPGSTDRLAGLSDLPDGPGPPSFKRFRDSEALVIEPDGAMLVAFENRHSVWRYRPATRETRQALDLSRHGWKANKGVEAMVRDRDNGALLLMAEGGGSVLRVGDDEDEVPLAGPPGQIADAARLPDGRILLAVRQVGFLGLTNLIAEMTLQPEGYRVRSLATLPLGATANVEGIAAEPRTDGGTRLWLMTDNDFRPAKPTLLVALDLP